VVSYTWDQVVAWLGLVVPLVALAWAALQHVYNQKRDQSFREYERFFKVMKELGSKDSTTPGNMAAVYELRKFPQYQEVIVRLCDDAKLTGGAADLLYREMKLTADHLRDK